MEAFLAQPQKDAIPGEEGSTARSQLPALFHLVPAVLIGTI